MADTDTAVVETAAAAEPELDAQGWDAMFADPSDVFELTDDGGVVSPPAEEKTPAEPAVPPAPAEPAAPAAEDTYEKRWKDTVAWAQREQGEKARLAGELEQVKKTLQERVLAPQEAAREQYDEQQLIQQAMSEAPEELRESLGEGGLRLVAKVAGRIVEKRSASLRESIARDVIPQVADEFGLATQVIAAIVPDAAETLQYVQRIRQLFGQATGGQDPIKVRGVEMTLKAARALMLSEREQRAQQGGQSPPQTQETQRRTDAESGLPAKTAATARPGMSAEEFLRQDASRHDSPAGVALSTDIAPGAVGSRKRTREEKVGDAVDDFFATWQGSSR